MPALQIWILALLVGLGGGGAFWLIWDYINHLRRQIAGLHRTVDELRAHNDELVLALEDRADAARIDEAIRKGRLSR